MQVSMKGCEQFSINICNLTEVPNEIMFKGSVTSIKKLLPYSSCQEKVMTKNEQERDILKFRGLLVISFYHHGWMYAI